MGFVQRRFAPRPFSDALNPTNSISSRESSTTHTAIDSHDRCGVETAVEYSQSRDRQTFSPDPDSNRASHPERETHLNDVYDFSTGLVTIATDVDNDVSVVTEYDVIGP